jgi:hypothetical protein
VIRRARTAGTITLGDGLAGGTLAPTAGTTIASGAVLAGYGTITGDVTTSGEVDAGVGPTPPGTLYVTGHYTQFAGQTVVTGGLDISLAYDQDGGLFTATAYGNSFSAASVTVNAGTFQQDYGTLTVAGDFIFAGDTASILYCTGTIAGQMLLNYGVTTLGSNLTIVGGLTVSTVAELDLYMGTLSTDLTNNGLLVVLTTDDWFAVIDGNFTQTSTGSLVVQDDGSNLCALVVNRLATLAGGFTLEMVGGASPPSIGAKFPGLIYGARSGTFDAIGRPDLPPGESWVITYDVPLNQFDPSSPLTLNFFVTE